MVIHELNVFYKINHRPAPIHNFVVILIFGCIYVLYLYLEAAVGTVFEPKYSTRGLLKMGFSVFEKKLEKKRRKWPFFRFLYLEAAVGTVLEIATFPQLEVY